MNVVGSVRSPELVVAAGACATYGSVQRTETHSRSAERERGSVRPKGLSHGHRFALISRLGRRPRAVTRSKTKRNRDAGQRPRGGLPVALTGAGRRSTSVPTSRVGARRADVGFRVPARRPDPPDRAVRRNLNRGNSTRGGDLNTSGPTIRPFRYRLGTDSSGSQCFFCLVMKKKVFFFHRHRFFLLTSEAYEYDTILLESNF